MSISFKSITLNSAGAGTKLKDVLDATKSCNSLFKNYTGATLCDLTKYNDTENVTNFSNMYYNCVNATNFPELNTSNGTTFDWMYAYCKSATSFPMINTSNGKNFSRMYCQCEGATSFPMIDTSNGADFVLMYSNCKSATSLPEINTSKGVSMSSMYSHCYNVTNFPQIDTPNNTDFSNMYFCCYAGVSFPSLNTSKGTDFYEMYYNCHKATNLPALDTSKATRISSMYYSCYKLEKVEISYYNISSASNSSYWCYNCSSLKAVIIRSFGSNYALNSNAFSGCYHLNGTVNSTYNPNGDKDGYIYVPRDMIETLSTATNWVTYASQLRALEDYTIDGTTTGELDTTKVNKNYYVVPLKDLTFLDPGTKSLTITLREFTNIPTVNIVSDNEELISISDINITTSEITFNINVAEIKGSANISVSVNGDANNEFIFTVYHSTYTEPVYRVEAVDGATYGFALNSNNYYESTNKGITSSYSLCKLIINNPNNTNVAKMKLDCINYGENNYDYGLLSNIDKTLTLSSAADSSNVYVSFYGKNSTNIQEVTYSLPNGEHFIYVKYRKDSSGNYGNDSLQFKVSFGV